MENSIYEPLLGKYVEVRYKDGEALGIYGKLIKTDSKSLHLSPSAHMSFIEKREKSCGKLTITHDIDLEEMIKRFSKGTLTIIDSEKVREVTDFTKVFAEVGLKLE